MAEAHQLTPREVDGLNVRDLAVMLHAAVRKKRKLFQVGAMVAAKVHNMGGPRAESFNGQSPPELYPHFFEDGQTDEEWEEEMEKEFARYNPD